MNKTGVFLDRDGTLNVEKEYLSDPSGLELIPGAAKAVKELNKLNLPVIVVTNQSGIGRGKFTLKILMDIQNKLVEMLKTGAGARIDAFYYCPHLPEDACNCRKPKLGMVEKAASEIGVDPGQSYFIGDKLADIELGKNAGGKTILVLTGYGKDEKAKMKKAPDHIADNISAAVEWIKKDIVLNEKL
ncbi:MAG: HAD family hydrolase [Candidatus Firestonebacteria bacterium]